MLTTANQSTYPHSEPPAKEPSPSPPAALPTPDGNQPSILNKVGQSIQSIRLLFRGFLGIERETLSDESPNPTTVRKIHEAIDKKDIDKLNRSLADRRGLNTCLPGSTLTPLHRALASEFNAAVVSLTLAVADLSIPSEEGLSPIIVAIKKGFPVVIINLMCEHGADVNAKRAPDGKTALHWAAATQGSDEVITALIAHGADLESKDFSTGFSPLWVAIYHDNISAVRTLLDYGCNPNAGLNDGFTPLYAAVGRKSGAALDMTQLLCDRGSDTAHVYRQPGYDFTYSPLTWAIMLTAAPEVIGVLLAAGADINGYNLKVSRTPLEAAIKHNAPAVPLLLEKGACLRQKSDGRFPLHHAVTCGSTSTLEHILMAHFHTNLTVDPISYEGSTPLVLAATGNKTDAIALLCKHRANINYQTREGISPLSEAFVTKNFDAARLLINLGADLKMTHQHIFGWTALDYACWIAPEDIVELILDLGGPVDSRTKKHNHTPLMVAASQGRIAIMKLLLSRGADLHARSWYGQNVLSRAVKHPGTLEFLLGLGVDVNRRDVLGATALHWCVVGREVNLGSVEVLLKAGARQVHGEVWENYWWREGKRSGTPAQIAREMGRGKLAELIEGWGVSWLGS